MQKALSNGTKILISLLAICMLVALRPESSMAAAKPARVKTPAVKVSKNVATITWKKAKNAKQYQVKIQNKQKKWKSVRIAKVADQPYSYTCTKPGTYRVLIRGWNGKKYGKWSKTKTFKSKKSTSTPTPSNQKNPPAAPSDVDTYDIGHDYVAVRWKSSKNAEGYQASLTRTDNGQIKTYKILTGNTIKITNLYSEKQYEIKIRAYNKEGNSKWSEIVVFTTLGKPSTGEIVINDPQPSNNKLFQEDTTTYVTYKGIKIHIGQTWTSDLNDQLEAKSSGTWTCVRKKEIGDHVNYEFHDEKVYLYNVDTYNPYLAVHVCEGQVIKIGSNAEVLGVRKGVTLNRRSTGFDSDLNTTVVPDPKVYTEWGAVMIWLRSDNYGGTTDNSFVNLANERTIAFHTINATRVGSGRSILKRSSYLEGVDLATGKNKTWSGTIPEGYSGAGTICTNQRYGAQAWAETMNANDICTHSSKYMTTGPCKKGTYRDDVQAMASQEEIGRPIYSTGENCATGSLGEGAVTSYSGSPVHWHTLMTSFKSVGTGFCGSYHCEQFSTREAE